jgi:hypothetical protein
MSPKTISVVDINKLSYSITIQAKYYVLMYLLYTYNITVNN